MTQSSDVKYSLTLDNVYEATVDANGIVTEIANTNVAVEELNFDITDPVADIDDTLTFEITNSQGSKRWSILQFVNHLDQSTEVNAAGNVSYSFKFDVIIGNYSWVSTNPDAYLVLELGFTFDAAEVEVSSSSLESEGDSFSTGFSSESNSFSTGFSSGSEGESLSSGLSSFSSVSTGFSSGFSSVSSAFTTFSTGFSTVSSFFSTISGSEALAKRAVSESDFSTGVSSGISTGFSSGDVSTGVSTGISSEFSTGFSSVSASDSASEFSTEFSTGFSSVSTNDGEDDSDPNDGLVEVIGEDDLALVQAIFKVAPTANDGDVSVAVTYDAKIRIIYSHFTGNLVHDPTVGIDSNRDITPAFNANNNNNNGGSSSSGNNSSSASHLAFSFVVLVVCFFLF